MAGCNIYAWDPVNEVWVRVSVNVDGEIEVEAG